MFGVNRQKGFKITPAFGERLLASRVGYTIGPSTASAGRCQPEIP